jgi:hypothetical protein
MTTQGETNMDDDDVEYQPDIPTDEEVLEWNDCHLNGIPPKTVKNHSS